MTAQMYRDIGQFNKDITLNVEEASDKGTYLPYWQSISQLVSTVMDGSEQEIVNLEVYRLAINAIESYARKFKADGVMQEEMEALLSDVKLGVESIETSTDKTTQMKEIILARIPNAEQVIANAYLNN